MPEPAARPPRGAPTREAATEAGRRRSGRDEDATDVRRRPAETAVVAPPRQERPRYPPRPGEEPEQLSFEDPPEGA